MILTVLTGLGTSISLIAAIGAQNAFVLRQGLRREHVLPLIVICALSDAVLIFAGIAGLGFLVTSFPLILTVIRYGGAAFLLCYGFIAARRALRPGALTAQKPERNSSLRTAILTCLAFTWLNPHVYLDTVLLLGSVATAQGDPEKWFFGLGAALASMIWFSALGYGSRLLAPLFAKPLAWRVLDSLIAVMMIGLATMLLVSS